MSDATMVVYRRILFGDPDPLFDRCLKVTATVGVVWALVALVMPVRKAETITVAQLPRRIAKLIVEPSKAVPQTIVEAARPPGDMVLPGDGDGDGTGRAGPTDRAPGAPGEPGPAPNAPAVPGVPELPPGPAGPALQVRRPGMGSGAGPGAAGAGRAGRELAQATVAAELAGTSQALSSALGGLSSSLSNGSAPGMGDGTGGGGSPLGGRDRGMRGPRAARSATGLGGPGMGGPGTGGGGGGVGGGGLGGGGADLGGSAIQGSRVAVGALTGAGTGTGGGGGYGSGGGGGGGGGGGTGTGGEGGEGGGDGGSGGGAAPGVYRSNASLLAVIQKYAAGIHYCYTNELKRDPALRGKLVFALTVDASGDVTEATIVENTLKSPRLTSCALSQVRDWKFPPVTKGVTAFQAPFVFTPPQ